MRANFRLIKGICPRCNRSGTLKHRIDTGYDVCLKCEKELKELERIKT